MDEIEHSDVVTDTPPEAAPEAPPATVEPTDPPAPERPPETLEQKRARLQRELKQTEKKLGVGEGDQPLDKPHTSELSDAQLDYFELRNITAPEDIELIHTVMQRTGLNHRDVLKDEYVVAKLKDNETARAVKNATPSSNGRGEAPAGNIDALVDKAVRTGELPSDPALRDKVVDALTDRTSNRRRH